MAYRYWYATSPTLLSDPRRGGYRCLQRRFFRRAGHSEAAEHHYPRCDRELDDTIADLQKSLPAGMTIATNVFRQSNFIQSAIDNVVTALRDGTAGGRDRVRLSTQRPRHRYRVDGNPAVVLSATLIISLAGRKLKYHDSRRHSGAMGRWSMMRLSWWRTSCDGCGRTTICLRRWRQSFGAVILRTTRKSEGPSSFATLIIITGVPAAVFPCRASRAALLQPLGLAYVAPGCPRCWSP